MTDAAFPKPPWLFHRVVIRDCNPGRFLKSRDFGIAFSKILGFKRKFSNTSVSLLLAKKIVSFAIFYHIFSEVLLYLANAICFGNDCMQVLHLINWKKSKFILCGYFISPHLETRL